MIWRILKYLQHLSHLRHRRGHGIHSPHVFEFVNGVLFNGKGWKVQEEVSWVHRVMKKDCSLIPREEPPGMKGDEDDTRSVSSFVKRASVSPKYGALLYRIARWMEPQAVVELGSGLGISTAYLRAGAPECLFHAVEGGRIRALLAAQVVYRSKLTEVHMHRGDIGEELPHILEEVPGSMLAFVDGNHHYKPTVDYVEQLLKKADGDGIIIMDDIYWSRGMYRAWQELRERPEVRVSVDLYHMGILLLRKDLHKMHFKIKF